MIGVHRAQVGPPGTPLFGSNSLHHTVVGLTIRKAFAQRDLTHDNVFGTGDVIVEIEVSEAQWGRLLTQPNIGDGVPCTIRVLKEGETWVRIERPPLPPSKSAKFRTDMLQRTTRCMTLVRGLRRTIGAAVQDGKIRKAKGDELLRDVEQISTELQHNLPWVAQRFEEDMEETLDEAKADLAAWLDTNARLAGVDGRVLDDAPHMLDGENVRGDR